jgi:hypothetical protein
MGPIEERCDGLMRSALGQEQPSTEPIGTATSTEELVDVLANLLNAQRAAILFLAQKLDEMNTAGPLGS